MAKDRKEREKEDRKQKRTKKHRKNSSQSRSRSSSKEERRKKTKKQTNRSRSRSNKKRSKSKSVSRNQGTNENPQVEKQNMPMMNQMNKQPQMMFPFPPFNMDQKNPSMPMPYGYLPTPYMPMQYNFPHFPQDMAQDPKQSKKQSPSDIGILLDKGLVNKKTVQQNAMFQNTEQFPRLVSIVLSMQVSETNLSLFLSVLKRAVLQLENVFGDLKIRDQKKSVQKFIQFLLEKDNFKKKGPSPPPSLDDIDLMHLLVEHDQNLASTINMYNSHNTTLIQEVSQLQPAKDHSNLDHTYQEALQLVQQYTPQP